MKQYTKEQLEKEGYKPAPAEYFTGQAWLKPLVTPDETTNCIISDVLFEPGTRNNWHTHPGNQILLIKEGTCYYQEEGKPVRRVEVGGVINILPGTRHWHGASPDAVMIHTAIGINTERGIVNWLEPVSEEQYRG
ncbi:cupin domain-containing protein [Chitinophaga sp. CF418]|uniref:cupin domain-containing protein n=1 Tax=Chitinophaga sp. CF418 TaxID=1855287 RepID=UPI00091D9959|nr:cupin domain-containing protein [Chitinophaga sp. CF418]SHN76734.1 Cupin domain protein [Chitinophaga sp. CF418]